MEEPFLVLGCGPLTRLPVLAAVPSASDATGVFGDSFPCVTGDSCAGAGWAELLLQPARTAIQPMTTAKPVFLIMIPLGLPPKQLTSQRSGPRLRPKQALTSGAPVSPLARERHHQLFQAFPSTDHQLSRAAARAFSARCALCFVRRSRHQSSSPSSLAT